ncbi:MAG: MFS transporter [Saprospiraceae bacterium]|nr:MFS transporter [Saprospiraceae bacterium]
MPNTTPSLVRRILIMTTLITAGEAIFLLPFALPRIFRPTLLEVFGITNLELGLAYSAYGVVAMIAYFFGGPLADNYSPRRLMTAAMISTALGGLYFACIPAVRMLTFLYGFWGLTTILVFWAALIRATREWGGTNSQGRAYGFLDGGRGLLAALVASITVAIFANLLPADVASASLAERTAALQSLIWIVCGIVFAIGLLVWFFIPDSNALPKSDKKRRFNIEGVQKIAGMPSVWLQAVIILCAYVAYKGVDDFSLYAYDVYGYDDVDAAKIGTLAFWIRPFAALGAGYFGDRFSASKGIVVSFIILILGSLTLASGWLPPNVHWMLVLTIAGTCVGIYALRGIYFALFQEANVPLAFTGTAVGLVSVIGYTPDIFMGPLMGYLLDSAPGATGHQHVFLVLASFSFIGLMAALVFRRIRKTV